MSYNTVYYVPTAVSAQAITAIGTNSKTQLDPGYTLTDGSFVPRSITKKALTNAAYDAQVGDYMVIDEFNNHTIFPAAYYAAKFTSTNPSLTTVTVENSAGSVTRPGLTVTGGIVKLAATDAIVANGASIVLNNHSGSVSTGNAGLNSPAVATVAAGLVSNVQAAA